MNRLLLLALCLLPACYEPVEGCLDIEAVNFDAAADKNCCCEYPRLILEVEQQFDTLPWRPDSVYQLLSGERFRLKSVAFYLSEFRLYRGGAAFRTTGGIDLPVFGPASGDTLEQNFINDFALVRRSPLEYAVGAFPEGGLFDRAEILLGLPDDAQRVVPSKAPAGHPLAAQLEKLWLDRDRGFVALQLVFTRDTVAATIPDTLNFARPDFASFLIDDTGSFRHESGYDFRISLIADYRELFRNVQLSAGDPAAWKTQIVANLPNVFRVLP